VRAYYKWEAAGKPELDADAFWYEAEKELIEKAVPAWGKLSPG
jgi:Protein of unknown function (DUF2934)